MRHLSAFSGVLGRVLVWAIRGVAMVLIPLGGIFFLDGFLPKSEPIARFMLLTHESWLGLALGVAGGILWCVFKRKSGPCASQTEC